jgi:hypothetical protein
MPSLKETRLHPGKLRRHAAALKLHGRQKHDDELRSASSTYELDQLDSNLGRYTGYRPAST